MSEVNTDDYRIKQMGKHMSKVKSKIRVAIRKSTSQSGMSAGAGSMSSLLNTSGEIIKKCWFCELPISREVDEGYLLVDSRPVCKYCLIDIFRLFKFTNEEVEEMVKNKVADSL